MGIFLFFVYILIGLLLGSLLTLISDRLLESTPPYLRRFINKHLWQIEPSIGRQGTPRELLPARYPLGIAGFTAAFATTWALVGWRGELAIGLLLLCVLYVVLQTDLAEMIIPNEAILVGLAASLVLRLFLHPLLYWDYAAAAIGGSSFLLMIAILFDRVFGKEAIGGGDIKLYLFLGLVLGIKLTLLSIFLASVLGLAVLVPLQWINRKGTGEPVPFGPFIAGGAWIAYLWGDALVNAYLNLLV